MWWIGPPAIHRDRHDGQAQQLVKPRKPCLQGRLCAVFHPRAFGNNHQRASRWRRAVWRSRSSARSGPRACPAGHRDQAIDLRRMAPAGDAEQFLLGEHAPRRLNNRGLSIASQDALVLDCDQHRALRQRAVNHDQVCPDSSRLRHPRPPDAPGLATHRRTQPPTPRQHRHHSTPAPAPRCRHKTAHRRRANAGTATRVFKGSLSPAARLASSL